MIVFWVCFVSALDMIRGRWSVAILAQDYGQHVSAKRSFLSHSHSLPSLPLRMAAAMAIEAHGRYLRLAAKLSGVHHQGLASVAGALRRSGCSDRRLLRRLSALDAAVGVLRHITEVSVNELAADLMQAFIVQQQEAAVKPKDEQVAQKANLIDIRVEPQLGPQPRVPDDDHVQQQAALAKWKSKMAQRLAAQQEATVVQHVGSSISSLGQMDFTSSLGQMDFTERLAKCGVGGRGPNPPWEGAKRVRHHPPEGDLQVQMEAPPVDRPQVAPLQVPQGGQQHDGPVGDPGCR